MYYKNNSRSYGLFHHFGHTLTQKKNYAVKPQTMKQLLSIKSFLNTHQMCTLSCDKIKMCTEQKVDSQQKISKYKLLYPN